MILDVRRRTEFTGEEARARRGGRIPAQRTSSGRTISTGPATARLLPNEQIRARYEAAGLRPGPAVITYCQGAVRAAHAAVALEMAGYPNVQVYDGSWEEWGNRDRPPDRDRRTVSEAELCYRPATEAPPPTSPPGGSRRSRWSRRSWRGSSA